MAKKGVDQSQTQRYKDAMDALSSPISSYSLLYEFPTSKTPRKKKVTLKSKQEPSLHLEKNLNKIESFPRNVKYLTVTGMLDEVAVLYRSASRETELRGIIKGPTYLCGCKSCNYSKKLNAYEFESHAGCKTCHPNNHIHLENGKSLHQVVQELKITPASKLCEAIQTVIGPSLNQESFSSWKESFEAALKLQPISGENTKIVM